MTAYFPGHRVHGPFEVEMAGGQTVTYQCTEKWLNRDQSHTLRCGQTSKLSFSRSVGVSKTESESLSTFLEGLLGPIAIASIKAHVEGTIRADLTLSETRGETHEFECKAEPCGSTTFELYQLIREYDFVYTRQRRFFGPLIRSNTVREFTHKFDLRQERDEDDPSCPCHKKPDLQRHIMRFSAGNLSVRVDATLPKSRAVSGGLDVLGCRFDVSQFGQHSYFLMLRPGEDASFINFFAGERFAEDRFIGRTIDVDRIPVTLSSTPGPPKFLIETDITAEPAIEPPDESFEAEY